MWRIRAPSKHACIAFYARTRGRVMPQRRWQRRVLLAVLGLLLLAGLLDVVFPLPPQARANYQPTGALQVLAHDGTPLRSWPGEGGNFRHPVQMEDVSANYVQTLLAYEDRAFYWHWGVNPWALGRAAWQWVRNGRIVSGGSTLSMQVARIMESQTNLPSRSVFFKIRQMLRALQLEAHLSKAQILTLYLNYAPMGGQIEGVEMAARAYLGKSAKDLSLAEAALLVALPQSPSRLRPDRNPAGATSARDKVLTRMQEQAVWPADQVADARIETVFAPPLRNRWLAPLAAERLRQYAQRQGGLANAALIRSTLDAGVQASLERILLDRITRMPEHVSMSAMVVENDTLYVRGYAGSADFGDNARAAHVDMVRGVRSPGSTLKPFLYAMALDDGLVHSESLLIDAPQNFSGYAPGNFESSFSGPVSVSEALQRSLNVPAVDLLDRLGAERFVAKLRNAGVKLRMPAGGTPNLSVILGGGGTTLEELVGAYTALARAGVAGVPRLLTDDALVQTPLMSPGAAFIVREILENGGHPDTPFIEARHRVAWKTGTSFGFRDAWAIGVTDRYTVGVWVGRPDGTPNPGHFGANTAAPLVKDLLAALGASLGSTRTAPDSVHPVDICWPLGLAASATPAAHCRQRRSAWALDGAVPPTLSDRVRETGLLETVWVSRPQQRRAMPGCTAASKLTMEPVEVARWPTLLDPWITRAMRSDVENWPWLAHCAPSSPSNGLQIGGIDAASVLLAPPGGTGVALQVRAIGTTERVNWLLDGRLIGASNPLEGLRLELTQPGSHTLTAMDANGQYGQVEFSLR